MNLDLAISAIEASRCLEHLLIDSLSLLVDLRYLAEHGPFIRNLIKVFLLDFLKLRLIFEHIGLALIFIILLLDISHDAKVFSELAPFVTLRLIENHGDLVARSLIKDIPLILLKGSLLFLVAVLGAWRFQLLASASIHENGLCIQLVVSD